MGLGKLEELEQKIQFLNDFIVNALKLEQVEAIKGYNGYTTVHCLMSWEDAKSILNARYGNYFFQTEGLYKCNDSYYTMDFQEVQITSYDEAIHS